MSKITASKEKLRESGRQELVARGSFRTVKAARQVEEEERQRMPEIIAHLIADIRLNFLSDDGDFAFSSRPDVADINTETPIAATTGKRCLLITRAFLIGETLAVEGWWIV